jgi:luciferase family oxidoreductase group 1
LVQQYFSENNKNAPVRATVAEGVQVPVYILGSSTDSAHLAAKMGLPYVFASHFSPTHLFEALKIYRSEFQPSEYLDNPYIIAGVNIIAASSEIAAEENFTSLLRFFVAVLTGKMEQLQRPVPISKELSLLRKHPAVQSMLKYSFVGEKDSVSKQIKHFLEETQVDELMIVSNIYHHNDRLNSYRITAEIMEELNLISA